MQAALACYFLGMDTKAIHTALSGFQPDYETSAGRLNMVQDLPFQFLMDYAHNLDGFRVLTHFTNQLDLPGQRIVCLPFSGDRQNQEVKQAVTFMAPHFDLFLCCSYAGLRGREPGEMAQLISRYLQEAGVPADRIQELSDRGSALKQTLKAAKSGDLVVYLAGGSEFHAVWEKMNELRECLAKQEDLEVAVDQLFGSSND
jgi:cyanophycin synthetase